jgi:hypothetical protein
MPTVHVHPIQLEYSHAKGKQTCKLCGAQEQWTAQEQPMVQGKAYDRTLHLVHLVTSHLQEVQATFATGERKREVTISEDQPSEDEQSEEDEPSEE